jgi:uncharacterized protein YcaQ
MDSISALQAKRIALAAHGFGDRRPTAAVTRPHIRKVLARTQLLQIDSVNVISRAHYLPVFARLGGYEHKVLDDMRSIRREHFEYWAHEASILPVELYPVLKWRMDHYREHGAKWGSLARIQREHPEYLEAVRQEIEDRGPVRVSELSMGAPGKGSWWGWSDAKIAVEALFFQGDVTAAFRTNGFERVYDLTERVIPERYFNATALSAEDAKRELVRRSAQAHGIATSKDLRDYFRLPVEGFAQAVAELVDSGELVETKVTGWKQQAYRWHESKPKRVDARAVLAPFDPLIWERDRTERIFGMRYRIEIYTPEPKREYGYYVLPFLLGEDLVGRVDLKADRKAGVMRVQSAHRDSALPDEDIVEPLAETLREMADWLGLDDVSATGKGELGKPLADTLKR